MSVEEKIDFQQTVAASEIIKWALGKYEPDIALACSFSPEDIVVAHMMVQIRPGARVFAIDTGRLNEETYQCACAVRKRLNVNIEWYFPKHEEVERLERERGLYSFRESLEARHECCHIRKVEPLSRALCGLRGWITGLRRDQSVTRRELKQVEVDDVHGGIAKINPLAAWTSEETWNYIRQHELPYNRLFDQGYASVGCAPCTRAIEKSNDPRAGRWWWENPEHKECGLHLNSENKPGHNK